MIGRSTSVEQTRAFGRALAECVQSGDLIALIGDLGAGKTQFVKGLAQGLGVDPADVASPTFVLMREYELDDSGDDSQKPSLLLHVDAYRLDGADDLESIGWDADTDRDAVIAVEWADRIATVPGAIRLDRLEVEFSHDGDDTRLVEGRPLGQWRSRSEQLSAVWHNLLDDAPPAEPSRCPSCKKLVADDAPQFPFCGERCRMVDLGRWLGGEYHISRPTEQTDFDDD